MQDIAETLPEDIQDTMQQSNLWSFQAKCSNKIYGHSRHTTEIRPEAIPDTMQQSDL